VPPAVVWVTATGGSYHPTVEYAAPVGSERRQ